MSGGSGRWPVVAGSALAGFLMTFGSSCNSPAAGSSCATAGGTCVLGGVACVKQGASNVQDCNPSENPGGAFCCLELQEGGGIPGVSDGGGSGAPDGSLSDAATETDAPPCSPVIASDYDQSCTVDTDCVAVGEVPSCPVEGAIDGCTTEAINKSALTQYMTAFAQAFASRTGGGSSCPCESGAVCRSGKCQAAFCGPPPADTLPACANAGDAGGMCAYSANTTCSGVGPPDACAYSDEFCCLN
jgi:hypothetical protein